MPDTSNSLLDFILGLLSDNETAAEFYADPDGALKSAGLGDVCGDDVHSVLPLVLDYAPVSVKHDGGGRDHDRDHKDYDRDDKDHKDHDRDHKDHDRDHHGKDYDKDGDHDGHDGAVKEIHNILNNYTYNVDDRDTYVDQSVNQDIWAKGDVKQYFDNDTVIASGNGAVAAGGDVEGVITGDGNVVGDGNVTGDGNIVGDENEVGNTEIEDSFNTDNSVEVDIEDSFQDNSDNSTNDSYNDNSDNSDNSVNDSFNETEVDVEVEDSFNDNSDNSDNSTNINDSFNDNEIGNKEIEVEDSFNKDESVDVDVEVEESFNKIDASDDDFIDVDDSGNQEVAPV